MTGNGQFLPPNYENADDWKMVLWFLYHVVPTFILYFLLNFPHVTRQNRCPRRAFVSPESMGTGRLCPCARTWRWRVFCHLQPQKKWEVRIFTIVKYKKHLKWDTFALINFISYSSRIEKVILMFTINCCMSMLSHHSFRQIATMAWFTIRDVTQVDKMSRVSPRRQSPWACARTLVPTKS